jgi:formylmethanofuran dehydrogenase subunit E
MKKNQICIFCEIQKYFHLMMIDDLFAKPKKKRIKKIKCDICGKYIKSTRMQLHKEKENKKNLKTFQFDEDIFAKPKKIRVKRIKCDMCGT